MSISGDLTRIPRSADYRENFVRGVLVDALLTAERAWWLRRAGEFERCKPTLDGFHGTAVPAVLSEQWRRLDEVARACRARAELCDPERADRDVLLVLAEEVA